MPVGGGGLAGSPGAVTHKLEADFSGTAFGGTPTWTDITGWWMSGGSDPGGSPATMPWGRQDQSSTVESSTTSFVLNNADGRFTPGKALLVNGSANPYYPNVKRRVRMRHTITDGTTTLTMFDGYVDSWTVTVQTNGPTLSTVSLSDTFARLQVSTLLRSMAVEQMLLDSPKALYPLDEAAGAASAGDVTGQNVAATVKASKYGAGTATFGTATPSESLPVGLGLSSPDSGASTTTARGSYLSVPNAVANATVGYVEIWFVGPTSNPAAVEYLAYLPGDVSGLRELAIWITASGQLAFSATNDSGVVYTATTAITGGVCDGKEHQTALNVTTSQMTMFVDGASSATATISSGVYAFAPSNRNWVIGMKVTTGGQYVGPFTGTVALFGQWNVNLGATPNGLHWLTGSRNYAGESTSAHFARLLSYRPNLGGTTSGTVGTVGTEGIDGMTLGDALTSVATAEGGVIQTNRGTLTLIGRSNWYDPATTLTLNAANGEVDLPTTWRDDTQALVNDVTVSRPNGADQRAVNTASTTGTDGVAQTSITANLNSDRDAADMAGWLVAVGVREQLDSPTLTVNLYARASAALTMAVCALKTYDVVTLINLPASAPASTMSFQVQGGTPTVGADVFTVELYTTTMPPAVLRTDAAADTYTLLDSGLKIGW